VRKGIMTGKVRKIGEKILEGREIVS